MIGERSLRRLAQAGAIRRTSPRTMSRDERTYVQTHGHILAAIRGALRTEPSLRTVVLFGSVARGTDRPNSDIDLAVAPAPARAVARRVSAKVSAAAGRDVDLVDWVATRRSADLAPRLLREGRPLRDTDREWQTFQAESRNVLRRGRRREAAWRELERRVLG